MGRIAAMTTWLLVALTACAPVPPATPSVPVPTPAASASAAPTPPAARPEATPTPSGGGASPPVQTPPPASTPPPAPASTPPPSRPTTACAIPAALRGRDLTTIPTSQKVIALTFDGGSGNEATPAILATLARERVPATFFLTGEFATAYPDAARTIAASHPVGNHTQRHPDLTTLPDAAVRAEIEQGARSIRDVTGVDPRPYFRFPFGAVDARRIALVNAACYVPFRWTTDTLGWQGTTGGRSAASVTQRVLDQARPGGIVLMHLGAHPTDHTTLDADALPGMIAGLRARGYEFVTLEAVLPANP